MLFRSEIPGKTEGVTLTYPVVAVGSTEILLNNAYPDKGPLALAKQAIDELVEYIEWIKDYQ